MLGPTCSNAPSDVEERRARPDTRAAEDDVKLTQLYNPCIDGGCRVVAGGSIRVVHEHQSAERLDEARDSLSSHHRARAGRARGRCPHRCQHTCVNRLRHPHGVRPIVTARGGSDECDLSSRRPTHLLDEEHVLRRNQERTGSGLNRGSTLCPPSIGITSPVTCSPESATIHKIALLTADRGSTPRPLRSDQCIAPA